MKKILLILIALMSFNIQAQIFNPVKWTTSVEKVSDSQFDLVAKATIENHWHLYSQFLGGDDGPIPTTFSFKDSLNTFQLIGKTTEGEGHTEHDKVFNMVIKYFEKEAVFKQRINLLTDKELVLNEVVNFMVCDDSNCLPPTDVNLKFTVKGVAGTLLKDTILPTTGEIKPDKKATETPVEAPKTNKGLLSIFLIAFFSGFAALLTPCVFPMIPMTVSFFTKQSKTKAAGIKNALIYGISIVIIYVALGWLVSFLFGADALNALSTNVWFNLLFFLLLVVFAVSFLGAFEIMLPNAWANKVDAQADRGGMIGIFFMALALAIVSFSCTGPIVGTLLVQAASGGNQVGPIVGMFGFSLAIALPFTLFAAFPGWLNALPKSGGWLNTVKVFLGFLELAFAFKFLSNADLVLDLHLLERETFIAIWIAVFGALALYMFGKIKLPHDSDMPHLSVGRMSLGLIILTFTIYLVPGLWGAPLKLISGFPPPMTYSESPYGVGYSRAGGSVETAILPDGAEFGPHDIPIFLDYDAGMAYAIKVGKPVMLDFTGKACVNCRKMEERVWSDPKVLNILKNEVVLISLYVDFQKELPLDQQYISKTTGNKIRTIGNKWSDFQITKYKANAQPYYVLLNHDGENLNHYMAYNADVTAYLNWLNEGLTNFKG
ncbi:MAG: thiol:disulfide interchange protein [Flavobacteriales bacterium CG11_big_fil_rev_8_21_14_0_20_35_7]|nr:MAG: thiol:disulfide interchange protein [Flavobacteriales bacterium CG11_big_fil_rev_8_21_14_0_20_35_7]